MQLTVLFLEITLYADDTVILYIHMGEILNR